MVFAQSNRRNEQRHSVVILREVLNPPPMTFKEPQHGTGLE
jgi:hypothetical protein